MDRYAAGSVRGVARAVAEGRGGECDGGGDSGGVSVGEGGGGDDGGVCGGARARYDRSASAHTAGQQSAHTHVRGARRRAAAQPHRSHVASLCNYVAAAQPPCSCRTAIAQLHSRRRYRTVVTLAVDGRGHVDGLALCRECGDGGGDGGGGGGGGVGGSGDGGGGEGIGSAGGGGDG